MLAGDIGQSAGTLGWPTIFGLKQCPLRLAEDCLSVDMFVQFYERSSDEPMPIELQTSYPAALLQRDSADKLRFHNKSILEASAVWVVPKRR
jgi:hypothetical protein